MATLEKRALEQALTILKGLDARFWVELPTGEVYGERPQGDEGRKRKSPTWPKGSMAKYYQPLLEGLTPGGKVKIDCREFEQTLQNSVTGWASKVWGPGSYLTQYDRETNTLSIMRTA